MKETQLSHCERNFVNKYVAQGKASVVVYYKINLVYNYDVKQR